MKCNLFDDESVAEKIHKRNPKYSGISTVMLLKTALSQVIFTDSRGRPLANYKMNSAIDKLAKKGGLPHFSCHTLRHTFATNAARVGVPLRTTMALLGHSDASITLEIYMEV